jgi:drug/metabolite transporter (DMT)-like permease
MMTTVIFTLAAAFANAVNIMTQHAASAGAPKRQGGWRVALYLLRQPLWLLGWVAALGGLVFYAISLHHGQLAVVQPLLVTELVFALVLRRVWIRQDVPAAAWASAGTICVALAVFLVMAAPHGGHSTADARQWLSVILVFGGIVAGLSLVARRGSPLRRAALFAIAAALTWALCATFIKATTDTLAADGVLGMLLHWPVYALAASGAAGVVLQQTALHVGPLSVSQPLVVVVDPVASIVLSVWLFHEQFTQNPVQIFLAIMAFAVMAAGVTTLSRTTPIHLEASRPTRL